MFIHVIKYACSLVLPAFFPLESPLEEDVRWYTRVCVYQRVKEGETVSVRMFKVSHTCPLTISPQFLPVCEI